MTDLAEAWDRLKSESWLTRLIFTSKIKTELKHGQISGWQDSLQLWISNVTDDDLCRKSANSKDIG